MERLTGRSLDVILIWSVNFVLQLDDPLGLKVLKSFLSFEIADGSLPAGYVGELALLLDIRGESTFCTSL